MDPNQTNQNPPTNPSTPSEATPNVFQAAPVPSDPPGVPGKKLFTRKNIFIILGIIVVAEIIWAASNLVKNNQPQTSSPTVVSSTNEVTSASLVSSKSSLKVGEKLTVDLTLLSDKNTDGVDMIITYDPNLLAVEAGSDGNPVVLSTIYKEYPQNRLDPSGKIVISGITDQAGGVLAQGNLGTINFIAKTPGLARISLDFQPGLTTDSNIIETGTGKDILNKVDNLEIRITP